MSQEASKTLLKVFGILRIIFSVLIMLAGGLIAAMGKNQELITKVKEELAKQEVSQSFDVNQIIDKLSLIGVIILIAGVVVLICGIVLVSSSKEGKSATGAVVVEVLDVICSVLGLIGAIMGGSSIVSSIVSLALAGLLFYAALTLKKARA